MTDLNQLAVSLTKHGAHKLATLLRLYDKDNVLEHLSGSVDGVNIELAQAKRNLSVRADGEVPEVWAKARALGDPAIDALVLVGIIASHHRIIEALIKGRRGIHGTGIIERDVVIGAKAYTNVAHIIQQLGYATKDTATFVAYDFSRLFTIPKLNALVAELLTIKLGEADWDKKTTLLNELVSIRIHEAFAVSEEFFRDWMAAGECDAPRWQDSIDDVEFFVECNDDDDPSMPFRFSAGHVPKKIGEVEVGARNGKGKARLLHNEMQTQLYSDLVSVYGKACVGTEVSSGHGTTAIDLVVKTKTFCWFYEIKTAPSVKACIRQAIPQLLEYAYWDGNEGRCDKLIVVGPKPITKSAEIYLKFLRKTFALELHYLDCRLAKKS